PEAFDRIVTRNARMRALFRYVEAIAATPFPVLITGETGVGKELFAEALHRLSGRKGDLITVNVAGIDDNAFSDTLFGHVKGAFTGADRPRAGLIEQAAGGTLFLDEIGDLQMGSQTKLLRVIQNRDYLPLGSDVARLADIRLVVATNKSIEILRNSPDFRNDLYHRLKMHHIAVPPLRERKDDIPLLLDYFCGEAAEILNKAKPSVPPGLSGHFSTYQFPGNVRELRSMVLEAVSVDTSGTLSSALFGEMTGPVNTRGRPAGHAASDARKMHFPTQLPTIQETTAALIDEALLRACGNQNAAARLLGISPQALSRRLKHSRKKSEQNGC
ncbi:MAG: sigma-54-dependent Fis family transcriptional regulator, partial [Chitinispirillaceae bacterium]|nr:sigma-54-dependent Fis family transcriptional regulator [Chitinispirillaceae bacterium]